MDDSRLALRSESKADSKVEESKHKRGTRASFSLSLPLSLRGRRESDNFDAEDMVEASVLTQEEEEFATNAP